MSRGYDYSGFFFFTGLACVMIGSAVLLITFLQITFVETVTEDYNGETIVAKHNLSGYSSKGGFYRQAYSFTLANGTRERDVLVPRTDYDKYWIGDEYSYQIQSWRLKKSFNAFFLLNNQVN